MYSSDVLRHYYCFLKQHVSGPASRLQNKISVLKVLGYKSVGQTVDDKLTRVSHVLELAKKKLC